MEELPGKVCFSERGESLPDFVRQLRSFPTEFVLSRLPLPALSPSALILSAWLPAYLSGLKISVHLFLLAAGAIAGSTQEALAAPHYHGFRPRPPRAPVVRHHPRPSCWRDGEAVPPAGEFYLAEKRQPEFAKLSCRRAAEVPPEARELPPLAVSHVEPYRRPIVLEESEPPQRARQESSRSSSIVVCSGHSLHAT